MAQKLGQLCYFFDYFFFPRRQTNDTGLLHRCICGLCGGQAQIQTLEQLREWEAHLFELDPYETSRAASWPAEQRDRAFTLSLSGYRPRDAWHCMQLMQHIHALKFAWINLVRFQVRCAPSNLVLCKLRAAFTWVSGYCTNFKLYGCRHA